MKVSTNSLKKMLNHVSKCKPSQLLEITNYYELLFNQQGLTLTATDGVCSISVTAPEGISEKEFSIIVKAEQFSKLISKTTSEYVSMEVKDGHLELKGNGKYNIEIFEEEDYPKYEMFEDIRFKVKTSELKEGILAGKNTKSMTASDGVLFSFLVRDEHIVASDSLKVSSVKIKGFKEEVLIPPRLALLIETLTEDTANIGINDEKTEMLIQSGNITIYGALAEGADEFPDVTPLFTQNFAHSIDINIQQMLQALDRLRLFVSTYDSGLIDCTFTQGSVVMSTGNGSVEVINYEHSLKEDIELEATLNSAHLVDIVKAIKGEVFSIKFGIDGDGMDIIYFECNGNNFILGTADEE